MAQFDIKDLSFSYPGATRKALDQVSLQIEAGEYVCVCGRSGCGKTSLLRQLKTVLAPTGDKSGQVFFNNQPLDEISQRDQSQYIGFVMQNPDAQIVTDKVWHELAFGLESLSVDQRTMRLRVAEMASYFGIQNWFHKNVADLSGGQKQLLNLASIMAMQPSVLILDEPTSQLDPIAAADFLNTVRKINIELGTTIIITEHRLEDVFATADRVIVMSKGKVVTNGSPRRVANLLYAQGDHMTYALPAPVRVYYGVKEATDPESIQRVVEQGDNSVIKEVPLTVREGRTWLLDYANEHKDIERTLPEDDPFNEGIDDPAISLKDVWFRYEKDSPDILRGVDIEVPKQSLFAIVGGNGAGKSTTLKVICGICKPYRGKVTILGKKLKDWKGDELFRGGVAMLPQDPQNLFVKKTIHADLSEMLPQLSSEEREQRILDVARICGVEEQLDQHPFDLSGGEQQRAALAKVLLCDPQVLLLDEPTKGIDSFFKHKLAEVLQKLIEQKLTVVMVSHDIEFCARYASSVSMFFDGSVVTTNTPRSFFAANSFYTTAANRMSRQVFTNAVTDEDVIELCLS